MPLGKAHSAATGTGLIDAVKPQSRNQRLSAGQREARDSTRQNLIALVTSAITDDFHQMHRQTRGLEHGSLVDRIG